MENALKWYCLHTRNLFSVKLIGSFCKGKKIGRGYMWLYYYHTVKNHRLRKSLKENKKNKFLFLSSRANKYWISHRRPVKYFISNKFLISSEGSMLCCNRNQRAVFFLSLSIMLQYWVSVASTLGCLLKSHSSRLIVPLMNQLSHRLTNSSSKEQVSPGTKS